MAKEPIIIDGEEWRDVPGYEGAYQASSLGRIRQIKVLKLSTLNSGYMLTRFRTDDEDLVQALVHRVVCRTFNGSPPHPTSHAAHVNGKRNDNRSVNLIWATPKENNAHKIVHGTHNRGERHSMARLSVDDIVAIRKMAMEGTPRPKIAKMFGVTRGHINDIISRRTWSHI